MPNLNDWDRFQGAVCFELHCEDAPQYNDHTCGKAWRDSESEAPSKEQRLECAGRYIEKLRLQLEENRGRTMLELSQRNKELKRQLGLREECISKAHDRANAEIIRPPRGSHELAREIVPILYGNSPKGKKE